MGDYVYSREIGKTTDYSYSVDIFKESDNEFRPIVTATKNDESGMGCSNRRSFKTEEAAKNFFQENEAALKNEAIKNI